METTVALNDGPAWRLGEVVWVGGMKATVFALEGGRVTVKFLANGRKATVGLHVPKIGRPS